ncbi:MAG: hypothetical protein ACJAVI_002705 [Candidatus Azotimanducaceae bacterium]|jgi:hypothetical protein
MPTLLGGRELTAIEASEAGFVMAVDQAPLATAKKWEYIAAESGDYQLAMAWVELLSGDGVKVEIIAAGETIREVEAGLGKEPIRLEARIANIAAGDRIEVRATPMGISEYRLGFQLAITTPTFAGAQIFDVTDFGALGDGETDDMKAIHLAVEAARQAGSAIVRFEPGKHYR